MEEIYPVKWFGASERFSLKNYAEEYEKCVTGHILQIEEEPQNEVAYFEHLKSLMNVGLELHDLKILSEACSINQLVCEGENTRDFPMEIPKKISSNMKLPGEYFKGGDLAVNKYHKQIAKDLEEVQKNLRLKRPFHNNLDFTRTVTDFPDLTPAAEFVVKILVYRPFVYKFQNRNASEKLRFSHEITALGKTTLHQLRDVITCGFDKNLYMEVYSTAENLSERQNPKEKYPSGFFFIDNVFYNDFRNPDSIDCSYPIIEWAKQHNIKDLQCKNMENVTLDCLTPRFGYPYLYLHQGECEHLFVFSDAKLLDTHDSLRFDKYPFLSKINRVSNNVCAICLTTFATWIIMDSDRLPNSKTFLCTECCNSYNYINGEKIGNFKLYPYFTKHSHT